VLVFVGGGATGDGYTLSWTALMTDRHQRRVTRVVAAADKLQPVYHLPTLLAIVDCRKALLRVKFSTVLDLRQDGNSAITWTDSLPRGAHKIVLLYVTHDYEYTMCVGYLLIANIVAATFESCRNLSFRIPSSFIVPNDLHVWGLLIFNHHI